MSTTSTSSTPAIASAAPDSPAACGSHTNRAFCGVCHKIVPVRHVERDGRVYLRKECPDCGASEVMVSTDAARYAEKREMCGYEGEAVRTCHLHCVGCSHGTHPLVVVLDVTNRCNMNCPICLANVKAMGFEFNPPMEYFHKVFKHLAAMTPRPKVEFFGGEPTARNDLVDIVKLARSYGLAVRLVTNGIRLADEEYCKTLLATGPHLMFGFDGRNPKLWEKFRKNPGVLALKLKALDNVEKHSKSKITFVCTAGKGPDEADIADVVRIAYEKGKLVSAVDLIPLQATAGPEALDTESCTVEDMEKVVAKAIPGVEFVPAGLLKQLKVFQETFDARITFGGAHPNCESVSVLLADDKGYRPVADFLQKSFGETIRDALALDKRMAVKLEKSLIARLFGKSGRRLVMGWALWGLIRRDVKLARFTGPKPLRSLTRILWGYLAKGKKLKDLVRQHSGVRGALRLMVLPYEVPEWLESARLAECPAAFAYEHPLTGEISLMPFCAYFAHKDEILRQTALRYSPSARQPELAVAAAAQ